MAGKITDFVVFQTNDQFQVAGEGNVDDIVVNLSDDYNGKANERILVGVDILKEVVKAVDKNDSVRIEIGTDKPVKISIEDLNVSYLIAPRVEVK